MKKEFTKTELKEFDRAIKNWKANKSDDADMVKCYANDRKELTKVLSAIKQGKYNKAAELANILDTCVRDQIPSDFYDKLMEHYEY